MYTDLKSAFDVNCGGAELPRYKCHKEVWALKIKEVHMQGRSTEGEGSDFAPSAMIVPEESGYAPFHVDAAYVSKHKPQAGGYYIVYGDGYKSFSPAAAFEEGYIRAR